MADNQQLMNSDATSENTDAIIPLSPKTDLKNDEDYQKYSKQLSLALKDASIFNIALTGIYGSGKSSILATFKKENQNSNDFKFVDISLSTFYKTNLDKSDESTNELTELTSDEIQLIERSILQQLIYSVPQDNIPLSRFKRITEKDKKSIFEIVGLLLISIWSAIFVLGKADFIKNILEFHYWHIYGCFIFLVLSISVILFKLISYGVNLREIKFKLHDAEFNITNEENKSILNDHFAHSPPHDHLIS